MKVEESELQKFFEVMEEKNLSMTEVITLIRSSNGNIEAKPLTTELYLTVDYSRTIQEMIGAGNYDWVHSDVTEECFSLPSELKGKKVSISTKLFHFNSSIDSEDVIFEMNKANFRPATLAELLALGENYPKLQKEFPIVALGSVWNHESGEHYVPIISFDGLRRKFHLRWFNVVWHSDYYFLGVFMEI
jgi:hypothetical protein